MGARPEVQAKRVKLSREGAEKLYNLLKSEAEKELKIDSSKVEELIPLGLDGVEVWHPENTPEQQEALIKIAKKNGLLMTGGSDFHGGFNAYPLRIGEYGPTEDALSQLLSYKAKKRRKRNKAAAEEK